MGAEFAGVVEEGYQQPRSEWYNQGVFNRHHTYFTEDQQHHDQRRESDHCGHEQYRNERNIQAVDVHQPCTAVDRLDCGDEWNFWRQRCIFHDQLHWRGSATVLHAAGAMICLALIEME
jgi:hypothetical protein